MKTVVQVVPEVSGGGAELLVSELHSRLPGFGIDSKVIYFSNNLDHPLGQSQLSLGLRNPRSPLAVFKLRRRLREIINDAPVIVHCHLTWALFYVPIALVGLPATLVYTEHSNNNRRRAFSLLRHLDRLYYRRYDVVISISESVRANLRTWLGPVVDARKFVVVLNGARILRCKPRNRTKAEQGPIHLVAVGSLNHHKGFDIALKAIALCRSEISCFTIVGDGPLRAVLEGLARELGIYDIVYFAGWTNAVEPYYHAADAALISSRWEGFGLVAVEELSTGLPLVCPGLPGLSEVVGGCESVFLCSPGSPESMAGSIRELAEQLRDGRDFSDISIQRAQQFDLTKMASGYANVYHGLFGTGGKNLL